MSHLTSILKNCPEILVHTLITHRTIRVLRVSGMLDSLSMLARCMSSSGLTLIWSLLFLLVIQLIAAMMVTWSDLRGFVRVQFDVENWLKVWLWMNQLFIYIYSHLFTIFYYSTGIFIQWTHLSSVFLSCFLSCFHGYLTRQWQSPRSGSQCWRIGNDVINHGKDLRWSNNHETWRF